MKRVVLIRSNPVNPDPPVEKMANALLKLGYDVHIVAWDRDANAKDEVSTIHLQDGEADITRFGIQATYGGGLKKSLPALVKFQFKITKWLLSNRDKYDIIHAFDFDTGFIAAIFTRLLRKRLVYHILDYYVDSHNLAGSKLGSLVERAEISVMNCAYAAIVCTEKRKEQICKATPRKLYVIHNTPVDREINTDCIHRKGSCQKAGIVFVGTFGSERFLQEVLQVVASREDVELHIGGFGELEPLIREAASCQENVYYYGRLSYEKTLCLESQCDLMFAMYTPEVPNHRYAAPNKFYEALMLGKPIIMAQNTGFDEVIHENDIGETVPYNVEGFHVALDRLLSRRESWAEMRKRARKLYEDSFSWEIMEQRITEMYALIEE